MGLQDETFTLLLQQIPPFTHRQMEDKTDRNTHGEFIHVHTHSRHMAEGEIKGSGGDVSLNEMSYLSRVGLASLIGDINQ